MLLQAYDFAHLYRTMGVEMQMGGADQWGNITAGLELIRRTSGMGEGGDAAGTRAWPRLQAAAVAVGREVRQERGRGLDLARPSANVALRVLPVLAEHGRPRRRHVPALVHRVPARADRGAGGRGGRPAGGPRGPAGPGARHHGSHARGGRRGPGDRRFRGEVLGRCDHRPGGAAVALRVSRAGSRSPRRPSPRGRPCCWPRPACSHRRARPAG